MSLLPSATNYTQDDCFFLRANISSLTVGTVNAITISTVNLSASNLSAITLTALNGTISSISTTSITLDGNTLDTGGAGFGATLLLNGVPIATTENLSSISDWAYDPAISTVQMDGNDLVNAGNIDGVNLTVTNAVSGVIGGFTTLNSGSIVNSGNILTNTIQATGLVNAASVSTANLKANLISTGTVNVSTLLGVRATIGGVSTNTLSTATIATGSIVADTGNYSSITVSTITAGSAVFPIAPDLVVSSITVNGSTSTATLSVTSGANFAGSRPNFTAGINSSGPNNFNNTNLDNCGQINAGALDLFGSATVGILADSGGSILTNTAISLATQNGGSSVINIQAKRNALLAYPIPLSQVNIVAEGNCPNIPIVPLTPYGGAVNIVACNGPDPIFPLTPITNAAAPGAIHLTAYSKNLFPGLITEAAGSILAYSGLTNPTIGLYGCSFYSALNCLSLTCGITPATISYPGVVYLRGDAGTKVLNGLYIDHLYNAAGYTLAISATGGCNVTIDDCAYLGMTTNPVIDGGSVNGRIRNFSTISALNLLVSNISTGSVSVDQIYTRNINIDPPSTVYISHPDLTINANLTTDEAEDPQPNNLNLLASSNVNIQCGNNPSAFSVNITGDTYVSRTFTASLGISTTNINLSTINGAPYVPGGGAGSWVSTAASALDMAGFSINNLSSISGNPNLRINGLVTTSNASTWTNGSINTLFGSEVLSGKYIQWSYDNNPGTLIADNNSIKLDAPTINAQTAVIGTPSAFGNTFAFFGNSSLAANGTEYALLQENNGRTFLNAKSGTEIRFRINNADVMSMDAGNLSLNNNSITNVTNIYGNTSGFLTINALYGMVVGTNLGPELRFNTDSSIELKTLSTAQLTITQTAGSDFVLFNNGDARMLAKRDAYVQGDRNAFVIGLQDAIVRGQNNVVLESTTGYINLVAQGGSNTVYLTAAATEVRGNMSFTPSNAYINNLGHIYGSTTAPGNGLAIDYMYGMFFNSSGRNANFYIDAGNLNMINYNSGINIASYNGYGTGNFSLYSQNNDMYFSSGTGRDINLNGGRSVSVNAAQPGGSFGIYTSTINAGSLLDTNFNCGGNFSITGGGGSQYVTIQNAGTYFQWAGPNIYVGTSSGGFNFNIPVAIGSAYSLNMNGAPITQVSTISMLSNATINSPNIINFTAPSTFMTGSLYFNPASTSEIDLKDGYLRNASYITNPFTTNIQAFTGLYLTSAVRVNITAPAVRIEGDVDHVNCNVSFISQLRSVSTINNNIDSVNLNINAPSTIISGTVQRILSSINVTQPILQYDVVASSGNSGSVVVTLPTAYTSVSSFVAFACMEDPDPAEMSVVRNTASEIEIFWQTGGGGSHTIAWNTMGT